MSKRGGQEIYRDSGGGWGGGREGGREGGRGRVKERRLNFNTDQ